MKDFIKYTLATFCGIFLAGVLTFFFGLVALAFMLTGGGGADSVKPQSVLRLTLDGALEEDVAEDPLGELMGDNYGKLSLKTMIAAVKEAKRNPNVCGIYLKAGNMAGATPAMAQELRQTLEDFRKSGKFIVAYGDDYSQTCYYVCSVADKVVLNPKGLVDWRGMASQPIFYKDLLEKLGVKMQVFKVGTFKSAVEPYTGTRMSEANRAQVSSYLADIWNTMLTEVGQSRGISAERLDGLADSCMAYRAAEELVKAGLVDTLCYMDGVGDLLRTKTGRKKGVIPMAGAAQMAAEALARNERGEKIAVYYAFGEIIDRGGQWAGAVIDGEAMCRDLKKLREDKSVKAVVLRVNSGGGSAYASEQIWHEVDLLRRSKPVVVSMGGMAASGGYYLSCAADYIVAEPNTLTGSIGIFGMIPDASRLLTEKLGLHFDVVKTNEHADFGTLSRPFNDSEAAMMQKYVQRGYELFTRRVADGRKMDMEKVEQLAEGRVWTGRQALENGLVDANGGLSEAVEKAAGLAKLKKYQIVSHPVPMAWYESLLDDRKDTYLDNVMQEKLGMYYAPMMTLGRIGQMNSLQARLPFEPNFLN